MKKRWTIEEEVKLKNELKTKNIDEIMCSLNRSEYSIRKKVKHMNLKFLVHKNKYDNYNNDIKSKYNWKEIQLYYNNNNFWKDVIKKFNITDNILCKAVNIGLFKTRNKSKTMKLSFKLKPRKLSEETKKKISESRIKYLKENPDKIPYKLNHYSKGESYPEKYFEEIVLSDATGTPAPDEAVAFERMSFALASKVELDSQGRLLLNDRLRKRAGLKDDVTLVGVRDHIELWNSDNWEDYLDGHMAQYQKQMAQARQSVLKKQRETI